MPLLGDQDRRNLALWSSIGLTACVVMPRTITNGPSTPTRGTRLGERLRQLRVTAGLTQTELAGNRFSKEYVSQIERGKTRPTPETIEWLAARLGVDPGFLANG